MTLTSLRRTRAKRGNSWTGTSFGHQSANNRAFRPDIQGLRAFAVVAVVLDHLLEWPSGGFIGVDIFFVLSGFLITGLLLREHERTGRVSFANFYRRRIKRIVPAALLVIVLTVTVSMMVLNGPRAKSVLLDGIWAFLFSANWRQAMVGTDYFAAGNPQSPLQHFWSLAVEEQFYFIWPCLMVLVFAASARRMSMRLSPRRVTGLAMIAITAVSFVWSVGETATSPTTAYFSTFSRAWELGVGAILACASRHLLRIPSGARPYIAWFGLAGIGISLFMINAGSAFPGPSAALPVLSTALVVAAGTGAANYRTLTPLTNRVSRYLGDISYSLYLWHFPVIVIGVTLFGDAPLVLAGTAGVFVAASIYSYHLVEDPIRRSDWLSSGDRNRKQRRITGAVSERYKLTALSLLALATTSVIYIAMIPPTEPVTETQLPRPSSGAIETPTATPQQTALHKQIATALTVSAWPESLIPVLDEALSSEQALPDVMLCGTSVVDEAKCTWGDVDAKQTAMTIGNSISMTYVEALRTAIGKDGGWNLISYGMFGCPLTDSARVSPTAVAGCAERLDSTIDAINRIKPNVIFISGVGSADSVKVQLAKVATPTKLVFLPGPPGDKDIHSCFTRISQPQDCVSSIQSDFAATEKSLANDLDATFLDPSDWFCYNGSCPSFVGDFVTKMDGRHMTPQYAARIAPVVREKLEQSGLLRLSGDGS